MTHIETIHRLENGQQTTVRRVTVTDATGTEYEHEFEVTGDGTDLDSHEYLGEGTPSDSALDALEEYLTAGEEDA